VKYINISLNSLSIFKLSLSESLTFQETNTIPKPLFINFYELLENMAGKRKVYDEEIKEKTFFKNSQFIYSLIETVLEEKMRLSLTTILILPDNISDKDLNRFLEISKKWYVKYRIFKEVNKINFIQKNRIDTLKIDVIGDVHGLYDELLLLIKKLGYDENLNHKENRKLLFIGDFIDRGPKSLEVYKLVKNALEDGHYATLGNHEATLMRMYHKIPAKERGSSIRVYEEFEQNGILDEAMELFANLPFYYIIDDIFLATHANIETFDELFSTKKELLCGSYPNKKKILDVDERYQKLYENGVNRYRLIHGHMKKFNNYNDVFVLEERQVFKGNLVAFRCDTQEIIREKVEYDYDEIKKKNGWM
jgi:bis(5'-nucleosyl)-tetraphosphatase (symmetrical)